MKNILMYHPQHSSSIVSFPEGTDVTKWEEIGYKIYHEANKDFLFVDWQPMFDFINHVLGTSIDFSIDFSEKRPNIVCPNLTEQSGIFAAVVREVEVSFFNFSGNSENFWGTLYLCYQSWSGGSNGMTFGSVWYDCVTKEWKFESTRVKTLEFEATRGY
jgi:hypothetical protein